MRCILCFILLLASPAWAAVYEGQLANGFKYVIKKSDQPAGKVEIRLVVKVGSRHELEDEKGIAHLVEHMAFRRSTHFAAGEISAFLNSQGMRWGNDSNALTTWEHTVYQLSSNSRDIDKALLLSRDWAGGIQFDARELALERKIVLDEMRLQQYFQREAMEYLDLFYPGREYSQRLPIGEASVIENLPSARIAGFYHRHYIAPRMTLLVVGDVDEAAVEKIIQARFASVAAGPVPAEPAKAQPARQRLLHTDYKALGLNNSYVSWGWVEEREGGSTGAGMQRDNLRILLLAILERRLKVKSNTGNYSDAAMFRDDSIPHLKIQTLVLLPVADKAGSALEELRTVVEQARRTGFSAQEIEEVSQLMSGNEEVLAKRVPGQTEIMASFLSVTTAGGTIESPEQRLQGWNAAMKLATPARLQAELDALMKSPGQLVKIMRSPNDSSRKFGYFTEEDIEQLDLRVQKQAFAPWVHQVSTGKLLETPPAAGEIVQRKDIAGGEVWTLSNGMQVLWQKNLREDEQIGIDLLAEGGILGLPLPQHLAGTVLSDYVRDSVAGGKRGMEINAILQGHTLQLNPWVHEDQHGMNGFAAANDLDMALQYLSLLLQPPVANDSARLVSVQAEKNRQYSRQARVDLLAHGEAWPWKLRADKEFELLTVPEIQSAHASLYGQPGQLRLTLTGIRNKEQLAELIKRYIAGIAPAKGRQELIAVQPLPVSSRHISTITNKEEANLSWRFVTPQAISANDGVLAFALTDILQQRLLPVLRHNDVGGYVVNTNTDLGAGKGVAINLFNTGLSKQCRVMIDKTVSIIKQLVASGPDTKEVTAAVERVEQSMLVQSAAGRAFEVGSRWAYSRDLSSIELIPAKVITRESLKTAASQWLTAKGAFLYADGCPSGYDNEQFLALWNKAL